jgi:protein AaeX
MIGEISIGGVFVPSLLLWALIAFILNVGLRRVLSAVGFYRFVWHRALFDAALFVILLACVVGVSSSLLEP